MNDILTAGAYGALTEPATLTIKRVLPGPAERIWAYLTDSGMRAKWLAAGRMDGKPGAPFELVWRNDELSDAPTVRPASFPEEQRMKSVITVFEPPRRLAYTWEGGGDVTFELQPQGKDVLLTVTHTRLAKDSMLGVAAGWHMHLDILAARTRDEQPGPFWEGWARLRAEYQQRLSI